MKYVTLVVRLCVQLAFLPLRLPFWLWAKVRTLSSYNAIRLHIPSSLPDEGEPPFFPRLLFGGGSGVPWLHFLNLLRSIEKDRRLKLVILTFNELNFGWAKTEEIVSQIEKIRIAGKTVVCYLEQGGSREYYLAAAADYILGFPSASYGIHHLRLESTHMKKLLDDFAINTEFLAAGKYKSAGERFTRSKLSPPARKAMQAVLDGVESTLTEHIAGCRNSTPRAVTKLLSGGPYTASELYAAGWLDGLCFADELTKAAAQLAGLRPPPDDMDSAALDQAGTAGADAGSIDSQAADNRSADSQAPADHAQERRTALKLLKKTPGDISLWPSVTDSESKKSTRLKVITTGKFGKLTARRRKKLLSLKPAPTVALVQFSGTIYDGKSAEEDQKKGGVSGKLFAKAIADLRDDDSCKAVIARVNSPGGSAAASEKMYRELSLLAKKKPLIVSFGDVAASGGYYIACAAQKVFAPSTTLTGSIGVIMGKFTIKGLYNKYGIEKDIISGGDNSGLDSDYSKLTPALKTRLRDHIEEMYGLFLRRVAAGRQWTPTQVHPLAQGRVWIGKDARTKGLVDETGGLMEAFGEVRRQLSLKEDAVLNIQMVPQGSMGSMVSRLRRRFLTATIRMVFGGVPSDGALTDGALTMLESLENRQGLAADHEQVSFSSGLDSFNIK